MCVLYNFSDIIPYITPKVASSFKLLILNLKYGNHTVILTLNKNNLTFLSDLQYIFLEPIVKFCCSFSHLKIDTRSLEIDMYTRHVEIGVHRNFIFHLKKLEILSEVVIGVIDSIHVPQNCFF